MGAVYDRLISSFLTADDTNFTSGKTNPFFQEKDGPPVVHYSKTSMYRCYYQRPQEAQGYDVTVPTTRFGSSPNQRPAVGIGEFHTHTNCIELALHPGFYRSFYWLQ